MTPAITAVRLTGAANRSELPLLVLGPALGTSANSLWGGCAAHLAAHFDIVGWDLPGHGHNRSVPEEPFTIAELAAGVLAVVEDVLVQRDELGGPFAYAGESIGGVVGLQLLLDAASRISSAVLLGTTAEGVDSEVWDEPMEFDVRDRLSEITAPVLAVVGTDDPADVAEQVRAVAAGVSNGELGELVGISLFAPMEQPLEVATLIRRHILGDASDPRHGRLEELETHLRAALRNGLTVEEIQEVLRQTADSLGDPNPSAEG